MPLLNSKYTLLYRLLALAGIVVVFSIVLIGCGESGDRNADTGKARPVLVAGDMMDFMRSLLIAAGVDRTEGYDLSWANFISGPPIIAAATGGSVDIAWMAETPMVFAQSANSPVKVIAASVPVRPEAGSVALAVSVDSAIRSISDLKGKKVYYMPGTILQYVLIELLESEGLSLNDIQTVSSMSGAGPITQLLDKGIIDAVLLIDPTISTVERDERIRFLPIRDTQLHAGTRYIVVPERILQDESAHDLVEDFLTRVKDAYQWQNDHEGEAVQHLARLYQVPEEQAAAILHRSQSHFVPIGDDVIAAQQRQVDAFTSLGLIRGRQDASEIFDTRFNHIFEEQQSICKNAIGKNDSGIYHQRR